MKMQKWASKASFMESSNNIIHPALPKGLAFGSSCFGRVMMSVGEIGASPCPVFFNQLADLT
jgi:hypothetical protein